MSLEMGSFATRSFAVIFGYIGLGKALCLTSLHLEDLVCNLTAACEGNSPLQTGQRNAFCSLSSTLVGNSILFIPLRGIDWQVLT